MEVPEFDVWRDSAGTLHARHRASGVVVIARHPRHLWFLAARVLYARIVGGES
ncbi:hypothetical protein [Nonomuraea dietziae]|uniref:hypothetical protein n=1 Tax=Nonomuraea dietziae TaxID=65515 RepID=UPI003404AAB4